MAKPPGSMAPGNATGTRSPTTKFVAPQTIPRSATAPLTLTRHLTTQIPDRLLELGQLLDGDDLADYDAVVGLFAGTNRLDQSHLEARRRKCVAAKATGSPEKARGTQAMSGDGAHYMASFGLRPKAGTKADIAVEEAPSCPTARAARITVRSRPIPKRETRVALRVDAAGGEHRRVYHLVAAPLEPALAPADPAKIGVGRLAATAEAPWRSISAEGSVKGKKWGRSRVRNGALDACRLSPPNMAPANASRVPRRSAMVRPSSTASPSSWVKTGDASRRPCRPDTPCRGDDVHRQRHVSMARICSGEVCVRSTMAQPVGSTQKGVLQSRDGWSGGMFRASKLNQSASTSGPSATSKPMATKMSTTRSWIDVSGWRAPVGQAVPTGA